MNSTGVRTRTVLRDRTSRRAQTGRRPARGLPRPGRIAKYSRSLRRDSSRPLRIAEIRFRRNLAARRCKIHSLLLPAQFWCVPSPKNLQFQAVSQSIQFHFGEGTRLPGRVCANARAAIDRRHIRERLLHEGPRRHFRRNPRRLRRAARFFSGNFRRHGLLQP